MKFPWMKFFPGDWLKEPTLTVSSPATRGIWFDLLCVMHESNRASKISGTLEQLATLARCSPQELKCSLLQIKNQKIGHVTKRNNVVTVACRRLQKEEIAREQTRKRVSEFRSKEDVTTNQRKGNRENLEVICQMSEYKSDKAYKGNADKVSKLPKEVQEIARRFEAILSMQWTNDAGKWVNRIKSHRTLCERVVSEIENAEKENRIDTTPAQYAEQIWKEFK